MISSNFRLICTDFDGTVFNSVERPSIPGPLLEALGEAQARGLVWVINTGRTLSDLFQELERSNAGVWPQYVVTVEREIHELRDRDYHSISTWNHACLFKHQALFREAWGLFEEIQAWVEEEFEAETYGDTWSPLCIIASHSNHADEIHQRIERECDRFPGLIVVRNDVYFRFGHQDYTKGSALGEIMRTLGVSPDRVFAVGDHYNDLTMLDGIYATHVAAPENAIPEVKELVRRLGGYLASQPCGLGVMEALRYFTYGLMSKN